MQALESLAAVYAVFEKDGEDLTVGNSECDIVFADPLPAMDEFNAAQRVQERARKELCAAQETHAMAFMDLQERMSDCQEVVDEKCWFLKNCGAKFNEAKRKTEDAQDQVQVHRERSRRSSAVYGTVDDDLNESVGRMDQLTAGATHDCHVAPRTGTATRKYLQEAWAESTSPYLQHHEARFDIRKVFCQCAVRRECGAHDEGTNGVAPSTMKIQVVAPPERM